MFIAPLPPQSFSCAAQAVQRNLFQMGKAAAAVTAQTQDQTGAPAGGDKPAEPPKEQRYQVHGQTTTIPVYAARFKSPYAGQNSLTPNNQVAISNTYTLYFGAKITHGLELYVDPEMIRGQGLAHGFGLANAPNTEVIHTSPYEGPFWGRAFFRYTAATGKRPGSEPVEDGQNQLAGTQPSHRFVLTAGKMSVADIFDSNGYANSPRTQFLNLGLVNAATYDYAADVRGYTIGFATEYYGAGYVLRLGAYQMPTVANGPQLDGDLAHAQGKQIELETHPQFLRKLGASTVRVLGYLNHGNLGSYSEALAIAKTNGTIPNIVADDKSGRFKYGFNVNFEQPLGDDGDTGVFARLGGNDGKTESFVYSEAEASFTTGVQISGKRFHNPKDKVGFAYGINGLGRDHRAYLEAGGLGFQLGDGKLSYSVEQLIEAYYNRSIGKNFGVALDLQGIQNPGYNADRGPIFVFGIRLHAEF